MKKAEMAKEAKTSKTEERSMKRGATDYFGEMSMSPCEFGAAPVNDAPSNVDDPPMPTDHFGNMGNTNAKPTTPGSGSSIKLPTTPGRAEDAHGHRRSSFFCEHHEAVEPFLLKELRTQVFDTYAICAALLTTLSSSRFFFDNRDPREFLTGTGADATVHCSFLLQHLHILVACLCTAAGLESMLVFVLCTMYSRSALAMPGVGAKVFEYFLKETGRQRATGFQFMLGCGILSSLNLVVNCLTMPTFIVRKQVPAYILDVSSLACASAVLIIVLISVIEVWKILGAARIIFVPKDQLDKFVEENTPLMKEESKQDVEV